MAWNKPRPFIDADIKPFYDGLKEHRFLLMQCQTCQAYYWPAAYCKNHPNMPYMGEMEWVDSSGLGTVASFNIHYTAFNPAFKEDVPYVFALVQLDEGPMFGSTIEGVEPEKVFVGMRCSVAYEDVEDLGLTLPRLRPVSDSR